MTIVAAVRLRSSSGFRYTPAADVAKATDVQGQQLIDTNTDVAAGECDYPIAIPASVTSGGYITATVTPNGKPTNTSEFSNVVTVAASPGLV